MRNKLIKGLGASLVLLIMVIGGVMKYASVYNNANYKFESIQTSKAIVEASLDKMNKTIKQLGQVMGSEKGAFIEFQTLVADSKKGQSIGGIMSQIQEKYPNFEIKDEYKKLMQSIETERNEFLSTQKQHNAKIQYYNQFIGEFFNSMILSGKYQRIEPFVVSSSKSQNSMESGKDEIEDLNI